MKVTRLACLLVCSTAAAQSTAPFDVPGLLKLVDRPPSGTSVEGLSFLLRPLGGGRGDLEARPDKEGRFTLNNVRPGRYSLMFPMPGRIETFSFGFKEIPQEDFELTSAGGQETLQLVVSMKTGEVKVNVPALPAGHGPIVALMAPADSRLTLRYSCIRNPVNGPQTTFRYMPPGKYRVFVVDEELSRDVAAYAPRDPDFLMNRASPVEVQGDTTAQVTALYSDAAEVRDAVRRAGPIVGR